MLVILNSYKEAALFKVLNYLLSCLVSVHAGISRVVVNDLCVLCENVDDRQVMPCTYLKVVRIVCRCDLYNARTELHINIAVRNNRYLPVDKRQENRFADNVLVSLVLWVYSDSGITQQRFRSCRSKLDISAAVCKRVSQVPEMTCLILVLDLSV